MWSRRNVLAAAGSLVASLGVPGRAAGPRAPRVLLVEDDWILVETETMACLALGVEVVALTDANEALDAFLRATRAFDLLWVPERAPGLDGAELVARARAARPDVAALIHARERPAVAGDDPVLVPPFGLAELAGALRRAGVEPPRGADEGRLADLGGHTCLVVHEGGEGMPVDGPLLHEGWMRDVAWVDDARDALARARERPPAVVLYAGMHPRTRPPAGFSWWSQQEYRTIVGAYRTSLPELARAVPHAGVLGALARA